ncbi:type II secretion system F family protein [Planctomicrobium sp. SH664]|uniref:type II secretion system F family protein n=1 Tax=Planctomicrobium sp. SH664 TaxID=3448125 RepID=UPI003F5BE079
MFQPRATHQQMVTLCRSLGTSLAAGIDILRAFQLAARKADPRMSAALNDILQQIKSGGTVTAAFEAHQDYFPHLFVNLLQVGEATGSLPEVLKALAQHYENNIRLRKDFISQISMPMLQFAAAVLIIGFMIWLLGIIGSSTGAPQDVLGFGLLGTSGALVWFGGWAIGLAAVFVLYKLAQSTLSGQKLLHRILLQIPIVGTCLQNFAIARFSWAFSLTQQAGMPIEPSLESSLRATSNGAYIAAAPTIISDVMNGETLTDALTQSGLFSQEFLEIVLVAETSGTVPEELDRLSPQFEEEARRSLKALTAALGWAIWACVAMFIIFFVFRIVFWYLNILDGALKDVNRM